jgi:hypothetical protein
MMRPNHRRYRKAGIPEGREKKRRFRHSNSPRTLSNGPTLKRCSRKEFSSVDRVFTSRTTRDSEEGVPQSSRGSREEKTAKYGKTAPRVNMKTVLMSDTEVEDEIPNSHYTRPQ